MFAAVCDEMHHSMNEIDRWWVNAKSCGALMRYSRMRSVFLQRTGSGKGRAAVRVHSVAQTTIQRAGHVPGTQGQRIRVLPLAEASIWSAALAAASGPYTEDIPIASRQRQLRHPAGLAGSGTGRHGCPHQHGTSDDEERQDATQIPCSDGKLYIAPILDCYNGKIVGLAMDNNMKKELCIRAFEAACRSQNDTGNDSSQWPGQPVHQRRVPENASQVWRDPEHERNSPLLWQLPGWRVFCYSEEREALSHSHREDAHGTGKGNRFPAHYDLLQPAADLYG